MLPDVKPSSYRYGMTTDDILVYKSLLLPPQVTNKLLYLDNVVLKADVPKTHMGQAVFTNACGKRAIVSNHKLLTTIAASTDENIEYVLGSGFTAGASVQWLRDEMKNAENGR